MKIYIEIEKRTPDSDGFIRMIRDCDGYAVMEVIEGQVWISYSSEHPMEWLPGALAST